MLKMRDVYVQNPALGDPSTLDKQLEENAQKLDKLKEEIKKFEVSFCNLRACCELALCFCRTT
jgi:hypothetical protein